MKKVLLFFVVAIAAVSASAQTTGTAGTLQFGAGLNVVFPTGDLGSAASVGIGPRVQAEYMFTNDLSGIVSVSYNFLSKENDNTISTLPIQAGARYHFAGGFFAGVELGYINFHSKFDNGSVTETNNTSAFCYTPHVGYDIRNFEVVANYQGASKNGSNLSSISLTGIYRFGGK